MSDGARCHYCRKVLCVCPEARERSEPILTAKQAEEYWKFHPCGITIRQLADALEHQLEDHWSDRHDCKRCDAARELLRRFREGS